MHRALGLRSAPLLPASHFPDLSRCNRRLHTSTPPVSATAPPLPAGRRQAEEDLLPALVPALLSLASHRGSPAVRETALQCLVLLLELPYTALHPHRRTVERGLAAAVDDPRRSVRLAAARARHAWSTT